MTILTGLEIPTADGRPRVPNPYAEDVLKVKGSATACGIKIDVPKNAPEIVIGKAASKISRQLRDAARSADFQVATRIREIKGVWYVVFYDKPESDSSK
jgi:hypothetical protein